MPAGKQPHSEFLVHLKALPDRVPGIVRLRRFLKAALRVYRLRCLAVQELPGDPESHRSGAGRGSVRHRQSLTLLGGTLMTPPPQRPSLREAARRGLTAKQQQQPAAQPVQAHAAPKQRSPGGRPPAPPFVRFEKVKACCGHEIDFGLWEDHQDKFREARRQKKRDQLCPACQEQKQRQEQEAARQRRAEKHKATEKLPRLPDGATFHVVFDAAATEWSGSLTVGSETFTARAGAVFRLLRDLDRLYRAALPGNALPGSACAPPAAAEPASRSDGEPAASERG
jgi:hypothetical protein